MLGSLFLRSSNRTALTQFRRDTKSVFDPTLCRGLAIWPMVMAMVTVLGVVAVSRADARYSRAAGALDSPTTSLVGSRTVDICSLFSLSSPY